MKVFADPTELATTSNLSAEVKAIAQPLPGLEAMTGADLLLSIEGLPLPPNNASLLQIHTQTGALLQLKRLHDLQASIVEGRLFAQLARMRKWTLFPWLIASGSLLDINGKAVIAKVVNKQLTGNNARFTLIGRPGLEFIAVSAAMDSWRYSGGYARFLPSPDHLMDWLKHQERLLKAIKAGEVKELIPRKIARDIIEPRPVAFLAALFDGIGIKTAHKIWDRVNALTSGNANLYQAMRYITNYQAQEIPGITAPMIQTWRDLLGLNVYEDDSFGPARYATLGMEWRLMDTGEVWWNNADSYRNDGLLDNDMVLTPRAAQTLIGMPATLILSNEEQIKGVIEEVKLGKDYDYIVVDGQVIRLDLVIDVELED